MFGVCFYHLMVWLAGWRDRIGIGIGWDRIG